MKALILYFMTGVATGWQVFCFLMWAIWGAPTSPLQYVSLLGSLVLCAGAIVALRKPRFGAGIAISGCLAAWCFYLPAFIRTPHQLLTALPAPRDLVLALGPGLLLVASTGYAVAVFLKPRKTLAKS
jgi:hypothetical protein